MNWDDLRIFLTIEDAGSLAGAARRLGVNHSTVFRRLNALEKDLGVRLYDRFRAGYVLTPAGARMRERARAAESAIQDIEFDLAGRDHKAEGMVRVTTAPNIARTIVPIAVARLRETHPGIVIEISVGDSDYDLGRREADIALRATTSPPDSLVGRKLMTMAWWICGAGDAPGPRPESIGQLTGVPMIGADTALRRVDAMRWLEKHHGDQIVARANDLTTMAALTEAGVGYSLLPSDQQGRGLEKLFAVDGLSGELWLLTHPDLRKVRKIKVVWDALAEAVSPRQYAPGA